MGTDETVESIEELAADPANAREMDDLSRAGLGAAIEEFGDLSGIVWNATTKQLVCGHQRVERLKAAGATTWEIVDDEAAQNIGEARGVIFDPRTGQPFPVRVVTWSPEKQRRANLVANNPAIQGKFTDAAAAQIAALEDRDALAAVRLDALAELLAARTVDKPAKEGNTDPDAVVEPPADPITQPGDLWILGEHRLLCGDSTKPDDIDRLMAREPGRVFAASLMATDPPYGVDFTASKAGIPRSGLGNAQERWGDIENDNLDPEQLRKFLHDVFVHAPIEETAPWYVWHPSTDLADIFGGVMRNVGILIHRHIVWVKPGFVLARSGMYHPAHEDCFYGWKRGNPPPWYGEKNQRSVWHVGRDGVAVHPTQKPVELFEIPMRNHTREGDVCYEPFSGSGSQIIAGERLGRRVFAMEISPRWCDAAVRRWEGFTGRRAEKAGK